MLAGTIAIARLAVRSAVRSRLFVVLALMLLFVAVGLPLSVRGDGTVEGQVRVALVYTLGLASVILGLATLWASCGSLSQDISQRQIQLLITKPVRRMQVWLGKWLGLLFMNAVLLALVGVLVAGIVRWQTNPRRVTPQDSRRLKEEILIGRRALAPHPRSWNKEAHRRLEQQLREGQVGRETPHAEAIAGIRKRLQAEETTVGVGRTRQWEFAAAPAIRPGAVVAFRYRLSSVNRTRNSVSGTWSVGPRDATTPHRFTVTNQIGGIHRVVIPASAISTGTPLVARFTNATEDRSHTAVFDFETPVEILIDESGFDANLARGLLVIFCRLALVAAIGMAAGSVFSFPVAAFAASSLLFIAVVSRVFTLAGFEGCGCGHDEAASSSWLEAVGTRMLWQVDRVVAPVAEMNPLNRLAEGILVPWSLVGKALGLLLLLYPALLGGLASFVLSRRELALPGAGGG